jgi:hypothetical protein
MMIATRGLGISTSDATAIRRRDQLAPAQPSALVIRATMFRTLSTVQWRGARGVVSPLPEGPYRELCSRATSWSTRRRGPIAGAKAARLATCSTTSWGRSGAPPKRWYNRLRMLRPRPDRPRILRRSAGHRDRAVLDHAIRAAAGHDACRVATDHANRSPGHPPHAIPTAASTARADRSPATPATATLRTITACGPARSSPPDS